MIPGLLGVPSTGSGSFLGRGSTGDEDPGASLQEVPEEIALLPPPSALHASPTASDDHAPTETPDAHSEPRIAN